MIAVAAASGAMVLTVPAYAGSGAEGPAAGSPGVVSGNTIQLPVPRVSRWSSVES
ncbi:chaplin family protein [Streptomyces sp. NPDC007991]|uniref:chaplin family protein n=1 Tax=Streptomyces sp. NPDC007991 TaxID=3364803 RepID=UPI0036E205C8